MAEASHDYARATSSSTYPSAQESLTAPPSSSTPTSAANSSPAITTLTATVLDADGAPMSVAPGGSALNPRSCVMCRRRKVRCDKHMPCSNCQKNHVQCIFPAPGRAPRRPRVRDPNAPPRPTSAAVAAAATASSVREAELVSRLRKLESMVEELSGQIDPDSKRDSQSPSGSTGDVLETHGSVSSGGVGGPSAAGYTSSMSSVNSPYSNYPALSASAMAKSDPALYRRLGRIVQGDHRTGSRYVSSAFWSKMTDEIEKIRNEITSFSEDDSDYSDDEPSPSPNQVSGAEHQSFIFGYRSADVDLKRLHALPSQIPYIWQVYLENVEPVVKIFHVPTINPIMKSLSEGTDDLTPQYEAVAFAIYFCAITSLEDDDVLRDFGSEKRVLLNRYRFGLEQALARANFIIIPDLTVLAALVVFLLVVRRHDDTRFCWTMTGLAIRIAQGLGLHRDGTHLNLSPFETELRRRIWWSLCILDLRCAEEMGTDLLIVERTFDTRFPLNINDCDITPEMKEPPVEKEGPSEMAILLIRFEVTSLSRRLVSFSSAMGIVCPRDATMSMAERERMLIEVYDRVDARFIHNPSVITQPLFAMAGMVARIVMAKMSLVIYQPMLFPGSGQELTDEIRDRLLLASIEIIEYNHKLSVDLRFKRWRWLFQTYTQWHPIAYVLIEMRRRPWTATLERAWEALNMTLNDRHLLDLTKTADHLAAWMPLKKLFVQARRRRIAEITRLRANPEEARRLDVEERRNSTRSLFGQAPGLEDHLNEVRTRWLALVRPERPTIAHSSNSCPLSQSTTVNVSNTGTGSVPLMAMKQPQGFTGACLFDEDSYKDCVEAMISHPFSEGDFPGWPADLPPPALSDLLSPERLASPPQRNAPPPIGRPIWMWAEANAYPVQSNTEDETSGVCTTQDEEDISMDMDLEEFNWQSWQETVKSLEAAAQPRLA